MPGIGKVPKHLQRALAFSTITDEAGASGVAAGVPTYKAIILRFWPANWHELFKCENQTTPPFTTHSRSSLSNDVPLDELWNSSRLRESRQSEVKTGNASRSRAGMLPRH